MRAGGRTGSSGRRQEAAGRREPKLQDSSETFNECVSVVFPSAVCRLPSAVCRLPSAVCRLPSAFYLCLFTVYFSLPFPGWTVVQTAC